VAATVVDFLVLIVPIIVIFILFSKTFLAGYVVVLIVQGVYLSLQIASRGQTVGNRAAGTKVVDMNTGAIPSQGKAWGRWAVQAVIGFIPLVGLVNILWPLWDSQNQTLHDKAVGTVVIRV
jgi:uncharacterized RDD family membrane protein YckC